MANKKKRKKIIIIVIIAVLVAAAAVWFFFLRGNNQTNVTTQLVESEVSRRTISKSLSGSGTLMPANSYTVTTLAEGDILTADFEEGDIVQKDVVLYTIDSSDASSKISDAKINYDSAVRTHDNNVAKQYVKACIDGTVYQLNVKEGDEVSQGQTVLTMRDSASMRVKMPFSSTDARNFKVGQTAIVTLDGSFEQLTGTVVEISGVDVIGEGNISTKNVIIEVKNPGGLAENQAATANIAGSDSVSSGKFYYKAEGTVKASVSGTVLKINKPEGSVVREDDIIVTLGGKDVDDMLKNADDSLKKAENSLKNAQDTLDSYTVKSPISGTVVDKYYKQGDTISNSRTMCVIYDLSYLEMTLYVDELDISTVSVGQDVEITADAVSSNHFAGKVTKVSVVGSTQSGTTSYPVTIRIDETEGLLPGMNVDAEIIVQHAENVLTVSNNAISRGNVILVSKDSPSAVNAIPDREAEEGYVYVQIETGLSDDSFTEIKSGLQEGDKVAFVARNVTTNSFANMFGMAGGGMGGMSGGMSGENRNYGGNNRNYGGANRGGNYGGMRR